MEVRFSLFGIPVQVGAIFVLMAVVFGQGEARTPFLMVSWIAIVFVGVLMHELGHALTAKAFGQAPAISLYGLGGVTSWQPRGEIGPGKRALITLVGPLVGIAVGLPALLVASLLPEHGVAHQIAWFVCWVNLGWGVLNLVPMIPLDGGRIMGSLLELAFGPGGQRAAYYVSIGVALLAAVVFASVGAFMMVAFSAFFIFLNVQALRAARAGRSTPTVVPPVGE